jgi:hypothetical protein
MWCRIRTYTGVDLDLTEELSMLSAIVRRSGFIVEPPPDDYSSDHIDTINSSDDEPLVNLLRARPKQDTVC